MIVLLVQDREEVIIENSKVLININDCVTAINKQKSNFILWTANGGPGRRASRWLRD